MFQKGLGAFLKFYKQQTFINTKKMGGEISTNGLGKFC